MEFLNKSGLARLVLYIKEMVRTKAVSVDGNQEINGEKTFTTPPYLTRTSGVGTYYNVKMTNVGDDNETMHIGFGIGSSGYNRGIYDQHKEKWLIYYDQNDNCILADGATVGSSTQPVYMSSGRITASSGTIGSTSQPIYMENGEFKTCETSGGGGGGLSGDAGSGTNPVYLKDGEIVASEATVGSSTTPIYMEAGEFKECETSGGEAEEALEIARAAQETATEAQNAAETAQSTADAAQSTADAAQSAADAAATTANAAQVSAESAQSAADSATTTATAAQATANEALEALSGYLPLTGGDLSGTLTVGDISITTDGHILLPSGVEIY